MSVTKAVRLLATDVEVAMGYIERTPLTSSIYFDRIKLALGD